MWDKMAVFEGEKGPFGDKSSVSVLIEANRSRRTMQLLLDGICEWG
jgi:hypothetical protein